VQDLPLENICDSHKSCVDLLKLVTDELMTGKSLAIQQTLFSRPQDSTPSQRFSNLT
jgi:hypothetical protein